MMTFWMLGTCFNAASSPVVVDRLYILWLTTDRKPTHIIYAKFVPSHNSRGRRHSLTDLLYSRIVIYQAVTRRHSAATRAVSGARRSEETSSPYADKLQMFSVAEWIHYTPQSPFRFVNDADDFFRSKVGGLGYVQYWIARYTEVHGSVAYKQSGFNRPLGSPRHAGKSTIKPCSRLIYSHRVPLRV